SFSSVLFPAPLDPSTPTRVPGSRRKSIASRIFVLPKLSVTCLSSSMFFPRLLPLCETPLQRLQQQEFQCGDQPEDKNDPCVEFAAVERAAGISQREAGSAFRTQDFGHDDQAYAAASGNKQGSSQGRGQRVQIQVP